MWNVHERRRSVRNGIEKTSIEHNVRRAIYINTSIVCRLLRVNPRCEETHKHTRRTRAQQRRRRRLTCQIHTMDWRCTSWNDINCMSLVQWEQFLCVFFFFVFVFALLSIAVAAHLRCDVTMLFYVLSCFSLLLVLVHLNDWKTNRICKTHIYAWTVALLSLPFSPFLSLPLFFRQFFLRHCRALLLVGNRRTRFTHIRRTRKKKIVTSWQQSGRDDTSFVVVFLILSISVVLFG